MKSRKTALAGAALFAAVAAIGMSTQALTAAAATPAPASAVSATASPTAPSAATSGWAQIANLRQPTAAVNSPTGLLAAGNDVLVSMANPAQKHGSVVLFDAATHAQLDSVTVGWQPGAIVKVGDEYWVSNNDASVTVLRIGGNTLKNVTTFSAGSKFAYGMTVGPNGNVYLLRSTPTGPTLVEIDRTSHAVVNTFADIAPHSKIQRTLTSADGAIWIAAKTADNHGEVLKVNPSNGSVEAAVPVDGLPTDIAADSSGQIWVANEMGNQILKIAPGTAKVTQTVGLVGNPYGIAIDGSGNLFASQSGTNSVAVVNTETGQVSQQGIPVGAYPDKVAVDAQGHPWVANLQNAPTDPPGGSVSILGTTN